MSTTTTNYGLVKPSPSDRVDIAVLNGDLDLIDTQMHTISNKFVHNVMDYGAVGNGSADDTLAIQAAIDAAIGGSPSGGVATTRNATKPVYLPPGTYKITAPLKVYSVMGFVMAGAPATIAVQGTLTYALDLNGLSVCTIKDITFIGSTSNDTVTTAVGLNWASSVAQRSTRGVQFERLSVRDLKYVNAFAVGENSGSVENDAVVYRDCRASGLQGAGWGGDLTWWQAGFRGGSQTSAGNLTNHSYYGCTSVCNRYNFWSQSQINMTVVGSEVGQGQVDFHHESVGTLSVRGVRSETSKRLYLQTGGASYTGNVTFQDVLFPANAIDPDGRFMSLGYSGWVTLINVRVDGSAATPSIWVNCNSSSRSVQITHIGCSSRSAVENFVVSANSISPASVVALNYSQLDSSGIVLADRTALWAKNFQTYTDRQMPTFNDGFAVGAVGAGVKVLTGSGTPEAAVTANIGSLYSRTDGGVATTLYVKETGTGNTGWVAK